MANIFDEILDDLNGVSDFEQKPDQGLTSPCSIVQLITEPPSEREQEQQQYVHQIEKTSSDEPPSANQQISADGQSLAMIQRESLQA